MAKFVLSIDVDNDAFEGTNKAREIARILRVAADKVANGNRSGNVLDVNGNTVGTFLWPARLVRQGKTRTWGNKF